MRKAFTLMEVLIVLLVTPVVMLGISRVFATFIRDIPRDVRLLQQNAMLLEMTRQIAGDVDRAVSLPEAVGPLHNDEQTLLIELPDEIICYRQQDGTVTRGVLGPEGQEDSDYTGLWRLRDATISWRCRRQDGRVYAVELQRHLQQRVAGQSLDKFENSYVHFLGALGKAGAIQ